ILPTILRCTGLISRMLGSPDECTSDDRDDARRYTCFGVLFTISPVRFTCLAAAFAGSRVRLFAIVRTALDCLDEIRLGMQLRQSIFDICERRQVLELLQPEVVEEVLRRAEHRRLARNVAMANDTYPVPLQERANDVAADRDAPHFLDLST